LQTASVKIVMLAGLVKVGGVLSLTVVCTWLAAALPIIYQAPGSRNHMASRAWPIHRHITESSLYAGRTIIRFIGHISVIATLAS
jgi:hypothetical protein